MHLQTQTVVAEDDEGNQGAHHAEDIGTENDLLHGPAPADAAHEEGRSHGPDHPIGPEEDGPVLREEGLAQRVGARREQQKILHHIAEGGKAGLEDVHRLTAENQHIEQQRSEKPHAGVGQPGNSRNALHHGDCVDQADQNQNPYRHELGGRDAEESRERHRQERRCDREGRRRAGDQGDDGQNVNQLALPAVGLLPENRPAGLGILLLIPTAHVQHEAEAGRQHGVETPGDEAPMEERIGAGPVLHRAQLPDVAFLRIGNPLAERIEKNVRRQAAGEDHGAPAEEAVLRLLAGLAERDAADRREGHPERDQQDSEADQQIVDAEFVAQKTADCRERVGGIHRIQNKEQTQNQNGEEGIEGRRGIQISFFHGQSPCFSGMRGRQRRALPSCRSQEHLLFEWDKSPIRIPPDNRRAGHRPSKSAGYSFP